MAKHRQLFSDSVFVIVLTLSVLALAGYAAAAETDGAPNKIPRQRSLEGLWSFNSLTRLERPDRYPTVVVTEEQARSIPPPPIVPPDAVGHAETELPDPEGLALARIGREVRAAWIVEPADGRLPFTPEGRARASKPPTLEGPESRLSAERCLLVPSIGPPLLNGLYNNNVQILQTKDHVVLFFELGSEVRIVPIGRPHAPLTRWMGDSVGRWDGDTLVIETTHFAPGQSKRFHPLGTFQTSPEAVVTERLRRISRDQILYSYTVVDPANFHQPWRGEMPLNATRARTFEYACHEGNYSLANILAGARVQERAAEQAAEPR